jgi:hypothetical protein
MPAPPLTLRCIVPVVIRMSSSSNRSQWRKDIERYYATLKHCDSQIYPGLTITITPYPLLPSQASCHPLRTCPTRTLHPIIRRNIIIILKDQLIGHHDGSILDRHGDGIHVTATATIRVVKFAAENNSRPYIHQTLDGVTLRKEAFDNFHGRRGLSSSPLSPWLPEVLVG